MKLVLRNKNNECIRSISFKDFEPYQNIIEKLVPLQQEARATLITGTEKINSHELSKFKLILDSLDLNLIRIYSENRSTVLSGKSLKINSTLINTKDYKNDFFPNPPSKRRDILHKGTIRSGNRISSNGDLFIMGDVNPGAIVSANNNIYVWGKLLGIALAGGDGDGNSFIASLYLNPLQLRICDIVAIGPQETPNHKYPEVAVLEKSAIIIKPYLIPS